MSQIHSRIVQKGCLKNVRILYKKDVSTFITLTKKSWRHLKRTKGCLKDESGN